MELVDCISRQPNQQIKATKNMMRKLLLQQLPSFVTRFQLFIHNFRVHKLSITAH